MTGTAQTETFIEFPRPYWAGYRAGLFGPAATGCPAEWRGHAEKRQTWQDGFAKGRDLRQRTRCSRTA
jgi:ribosome modulation factor